ncbi:hypothetical protein [Mesorhizobium sp.]|uniref:hypothetical protein n=1 Tax=Mesorhizobium sp. TaxID=1871066 RepID=UPI000FE50CA9|nr:hypothetical protein [Mesorhizobium sp.]RWI88900.1 MAG: hypothetical protein EOR21_26285 [Mesorhizobium sp.]
MTADLLARAVIGTLRRTTVTMTVEQAAEFNRLLRSPPSVGEDSTGQKVHQIFLMGKMMNGILNEGAVGRNVSYGYDRVRYLRPVCAGERLISECEIVAKKSEKAEVTVEERLLDETGEQIAVALHLYRFF